MNYRPQSRTRVAAFTLIELLTVITIIAILMGLLFPAIGIAKDQARKAEAKAAVTGIVTAVKQYYTEYGKYPLGEQATSGQDVIFGDAIPNQKLFDILRNISDTTPGQPNTYNPRGISFFDGKIVSDDTVPKSGFARVDAASYNVYKNCYVDPWGRQYQIAIDGDYDNKISNLPYTDFQNDNAPLTGACAFSMGKDNAIGNGTKTPGGDRTFKTNGTASDDIVSWQ